jgi:hypothetical protein
MLAGLSKCDSLSMPPCFCAKAGPAAEIAASSTPKLNMLRKFIIMLFFSDYGSYLSSQTSSIRQPLYMLLVINVRPLTQGSQQEAPAG